MLYINLIYFSKEILILKVKGHGLGWTRGVIVKTLDWKMVVCMFELYPHCYIQFRRNAFGKGMNPLIPQAMG